MRHDFSTGSIREGVLWADDNIIQVITDQEIKEGDEIKFFASANPFFNNSRTPVIIAQCDAIIEERPSGGKWKNNQPPTWRKIKYRRHAAA